jgi:isochorismate synthase
MTPVDTTIVTRFTKAFNKAVTMNHAVACWAEPGSGHFNLLIDKNPHPHTQSVRWTDDTRGFLVHPFVNDAHDASILLKPDLLFHLEHFSSEDSNQLKDYQEDHFPYSKLQELQAAEEREDETNYTVKVEHLLEEIKTGSIKKIVLARHKDVMQNHLKDPVLLAIELRKLYPNAFISLIYHPQIGCWMGASPELLVAMDKEGIFSTIALAGTQTYNKHKSLKEHHWTNKEIEEQAIVTRYIINCFKTIRLREYEEEGPKNYLAGNLVHLCTSFKVDTKALHIANLADQMLPLLHPTSATCGEPKVKALALIKQYEQAPRSLYTGFLGPVNLGHKSAVYVNLRCAQLYANGYRAFAGAGITADSIPAQEWIETEHKLQSIEKIWGINA